MNRNFLCSAGTDCVLTPNKGFEFISCVENVGDKPTRNPNVVCRKEKLDEIKNDIEDAYSKGKIMRVTVMVY